jgi:hypothetical protein
MIEYKRFTGYLYFRWWRFFFTYYDSSWQGRAFRFGLVLREGKPKQEPM